MSTATPTPTSAAIPAKARIAIVAAKYNADIVAALLEGCQTRLAERGAKGKRVQVFRVPGAFELPIAAKALAKSKRFAAIICLGAVVRGETPHFEYVAGQAAGGIQQAALETMVPIIFGVLTTNTAEQAWARCGGPHGHAGQRAADAAADMIDLLKSI